MALGKTYNVCLEMKILKALKGSMKRVIPERVDSSLVEERRPQLESTVRIAREPPRGLSEEVVLILIHHRQVVLEIVL